MSAIDPPAAAPTIVPILGEPDEEPELVVSIVEPEAPFKSDRVLVLPLAPSPLERYVE
jgi:hypothetical protein